MKVSIEDHYAVMDLGIIGEPIDSHYTTMSSNFSETRKCVLVNTIQKFKGIIIQKTVGLRL